MTEANQPTPEEGLDTSSPSGSDYSTNEDESVDRVADEGGVSRSDVDGDRVADEGGVSRSDEPDFQDKIDELTADLQRLQAEYVNYKRRVDRDRQLVEQNATYKVLAPIVEVLDTIDRAREHGELEGDANAGFKAVADQLERIVTGLGLAKFGEPGEAFDPQLHEALSHLGTDPEVKETSVKVVAKAGYRIGDRVVRAAQVLVVDPE